MRSRCGMCANVYDYSINQKTDLKKKHLTELHSMLENKTDSKFHEILNLVVEKIVTIKDR